MDGFLGNAAALAKRRLAIKVHLGEASLAVVILGLVACIYWQCLPHTVQELDTGELVANSWVLAVPHPPGAPLYTLLLHFFTHLLNAGTVFWRAAVVNAALALSTLAILARMVHTSTPNAGARVLGYTSLVLPLALSKVFWAYAVRPDVFMANACILVGMCWLYLSERPQALRILGLTALLGLGLGVHQSIVFAAPLVAHAMWEGRRWSLVIWGPVMFVAIVVASYASLLGMHPSAMESWGHLQTAGDVIRHALRRDYGTFQLDGHGEPVAWARNLLLLAQTCLVSTPVAALLVAATVRRCRHRPWSKHRRRYAVMGTVLLFYVVVFFALANTQSEAILERFFIFPLVLLSVLATGHLTWNFGRRGRAAFAVLAMLGVVSQLGTNWDINHLAEDTIIEDYAQNLLRMTHPGARNALVVDGDTRVFALRYVQSVLNFRPDVLVLNLGNLFAGQNWPKIARSHPDFHFSGDWRRGPSPAGVFAHVVAPNIERYTFYFTRNIILNHYHVTFLGLGRKITQGQGVEVDTKSAQSLVLRTTADSLSHVLRAPSLNYSERKDLYSEYAYIYLKAAQVPNPLWATADPYDEAVRRVPYCFVALRKLCDLRAPDSAAARACVGEVEALAALEFDYYP